jgi:hypothetical protein
MNARFWSPSPSGPRLRRVLATALALTTGSLGLGTTPAAQAAPVAAETVVALRQTDVLAQERGTVPATLPGGTGAITPVPLTRNVGTVDGLPPTYPIETRIVISAPDSFEVNVGKTSYENPPAASWPCTTGVWVLALTRKSLEPADSTLPMGKDMPLCSNNDAKALGKYFTTLGHDLVVVNSLFHQDNNTAGPLPSLSLAMEELGAAPEAPLPPSPIILRTGNRAPGDFAPDVDGTYLSTHVFTLVGQLGLAPGSRQLAWGDGSADDVPAGSQSTASIDGTLVTDADQDYDLVHEQRVLYDIATDSTVTIGDQVYPGRSVDSGGGFHLVAVDRRALKPLLDQSFDTSGADGPQQSAEMVDKLATLNSPEVLFFIASYGDPANDDQGLNYGANGASYYGLPQRVFDWLVYLGATPEALTDLVAHPRYALVGAVGATYEQPEPFPSAEASTAVAQAQDPGADITATGELQGVLGIGNTDMWYGSIMDNPPLILTVNHEAQPPSMANFGLADLIASTTAPWPYTSDASDPEHAGYLAAYAAVSNKLCSGCQGDIRQYYNGSDIDAWQGQTNNWLIDIKAGDDPYTPTSDYTKDEFDNMVGEIDQELRDVQSVDKQQDVMDTILHDVADSANGALQKAYETVKDSIVVPPTDHVLSILFDVFTELVKAVPEVGQVAGLVMSLGQDIAEIATSAVKGGGEDDGPSGALATTADAIAAQAEDAFANESTSVDQDFDLIFSDYGKLSTYADKVVNVPGWDLRDHKDSVESAMKNAAEISFYKSLLPVVYYVVHGTAMKLEKSNESQAPDPADWCLTETHDYCASAGKVQYEYGTSAYAFPNGRLDVQTPGWDVMILGQSVAGALEPLPVPASLVTAINNLGVAPSDVLLRWPMNRYYCPVGSGALCVSGND